jgi:L-fuculose-phosphate aldolase
MSGSDTGAMTRLRRRWLAARSSRTSAEAAVVDTARALSTCALVAGTAGNVSIRLSDELLITPTRMSYRAMGRRDLVAVTLDGTQVRGRHAPSRELALHLEIYRRRPDVGAVIHTHSPHATAWSFLGRPLLPATEDVGYYGIGPIGTAPAAPPGSAELAEGAAAELGSSGAVLLARHGVVAVGEDVAVTLAIAQAVEHQAQVAWLLRSEAAGRGPSALRRDAAAESVTPMRARAVRRGDE